MNNISEIQAAWIAGLFEGEGCISWCDKTSVALKLTMTDEDVVQRLFDLTGVGYITMKTKNNESSKQAWNWTLQHAEEVKTLLTLLLPFFGNRRAAKAVASLERLSNNRGKSPDGQRKRPLRLTCPKCNLPKEPGPGRRYCESCRRGI